MIGRQLGPYQLLAKVGEGGMGEVYRARDRRLNRDVAVKILPPSVADNPARRARFEREAQAISQLSHPHICAIYDVGRLRVDASASQGDVEVDFLVMELVEGESLEQRLRLGPLPWKTALPWAIQIAAALDAAHRRGIVHRDLKPANVMIGETGVKLLDFGVAKLLEGSDAAQAAVAAAPTESLTSEHRIVGTIHYMAPEQLEGRVVDARADLFAFGITLFEMLTARKAFDGASAASVSAAILKEDPPSIAISGAVPDAPPALDHVIRRALAKEPDERWQTARDLMLELRAILEGRARDVAAITGPPPRRSAAATAAITAGLLAAGGIGGWLARTPAPVVPAPVSIFTITAPEGTKLLSGYGLLAVSPDGRRISFLAGPEPGQERVWIRDLGATMATPVPGTEGGSNHFWSPDGQSVAFVAADRLSLQRVELRTSARSPIMSFDRRPVLGGIPIAFWGPGDTIVVADQGLRRIAARGGGQPSVVLAPDPAEPGAALFMPSPLPDGRFLYVQSFLGSGQTSELRVGTLDGRIAAKFPTVRSNAAYSSGYLVYRREESLVGQPFDPATLTLSGQPVVLVESVQYNPGNQRTVFAVAGDVLAYRAPIPNQLVWKNRKGETIGSIGVPGLEANASVVRDGSGRVAVDHHDPATRTMNIWTYDAVGGSPKALTFASRVRFPVWSPRGDWLAYFVVLGTNSGELRRIRSDGSGEELLLRGAMLPFDWSPDGRGIVYLMRETGDLWFLPVEGDRRPVRLTETPAHESSARLSPDGKWLAVTVSDAKQRSIWVQAFPGGGERRPIAGAAGSDASWSGDQRELFYMAADGTVMAVPMKTTDTSWTSGPPVALFKTNSGFLDIRALCVSPDAQRFLVPERAAVPDAITVMLNWTSRLR